MSFFKKLFGSSKKSPGATVVYDVSKDVVRRFLRQIATEPAYTQLKQAHPNIPDDHLAVLMYSASEMARKMPDAGENQAFDLAMRSCAAYDQGRVSVEEFAITYSVVARTDI